jgi:hypothetical protein
MVEYDGKVRAHHVASLNVKTPRPILNEQIDVASHVMK